MESVDWKLVRSAQVPGMRCHSVAKNPVSANVVPAGPGQHDAHIRTGTLNDRLSTGGWSGHTGKVRFGGPEQPPCTVQLSSSVCRFSIPSTHAKLPRSFQDQVCDVNVVCARGAAISPTSEIFRSVAGQYSVKQGMLTEERVIGARYITHARKLTRSASRDHHASAPICCTVAPHRRWG
jgi:hypothetical protein